MSRSSPRYTGVLQKSCSAKTMEILLSPCENAANLQAITHAEV